MKIKKGDKVKVIAGRDKDKIGIVATTLPRFDKVVVEGVNIRKKHLRPTRDGQSGQRVEVEAPIDASNVMLICPHTDKVTRIGYKVENGRKVRVSKRSGKEI